MQLSITTNFPDIQRQLERLHKDIAGKATASAINKTVEMARTDMSREIRKEFNLQAGEVRQQLRIKRAYFKAGGLTIEAVLIGGRQKGRALNLIRFTTNKSALKRKNGKAPELFVKIKRTGGKKSLGPKAFIGNKGRTVFTRVGDGRLPIKPLRTIDVAQMFNTKRINEAVLKRVQSTFPKVFEREAAFYLRKFGGKA